jgi:hypothetical protein
LTIFLKIIKLFEAYLVTKMKKRISHDRNDESPEAKARWFQSLTLEERMDLLCEFTDLILAVNPKIVESKNVTSTSGRVFILSKTRS